MSVTIPGELIIVFVVLWAIGKGLDLANKILERKIQRLRNEQERLKNKCPTYP